MLATNNTTVNAALLANQEKIKAVIVKTSWSVGHFLTPTKPPILQIQEKEQ